MGIFDQVKQLKNIPGGMKTISKLKQVQKELAQERIEVNENGIKIVTGCDMMFGGEVIKELEIDGAPNLRLKDALNKSLKKTVEQTGKRMQNMEGLSGLMGQ